MSASLYKSRYENLPVLLEGQAPKIVKVNQYRLAGPGGNYNAAGNNLFLQTLKKNGIDHTLRIHVGTGVLTIQPNAPSKKDKLNEWTVQNAEGRTVATEMTRVNWAALAHYVFLGKGAPEHCQIVLQLAYYWGIDKDLQSYADTWLGLDCNGFVGNYLWHYKKNKTWDVLGLENWILGPDALISEFVRRNRIQRWEQLDPLKTYVMAKVDKNGEPIPGGPNSPAGHIVITDPSKPKRDQQTKGLLSPAVKVVESTGSATPGLIESYYNCRGVRGGVFSMFREQVGANPDIDVRIAEWK